MHGLPFFWFNISHLWGREGETWLAQRCFFFFLLLKEAFSHSSVLSLRRFYYQPLCFYIYKSFLQLLWTWKKKLWFEGKGPSFHACSLSVVPLLQRERRETILLSQFSKVSESQRGDSSSQLDFSLSVKFINV